MNWIATPVLTGNKKALRFAWKYESENWLITRKGNRNKIYRKTDTSGWYFIKSNNENIDFILRVFDSMEGEK